MLEHRREYLHRSAEKTETKLILVWVEAATEVVRQHLFAPEKAAIPQSDSDADSKVYTKMKLKSIKNFT
jgi:predicted kinase